MEGNTIKCKIVLLGDQSVGKTSIINRFIFDNFTGNEQVYLSLLSPLLASISSAKQLTSKIKVYACNCGTLQDKKDSILSSPHTSKIVMLLSSSMILQVSILSSRLQFLPEPIKVDR